MAIHPAIKVFKHLRSQFSPDAVSFHIECLLYAILDSLFAGSPGDYLLKLFDYIAATPADVWYSKVLWTPCRDRDIFKETKWIMVNWLQFHKIVNLATRAARLANEATTLSGAIEAWQTLLSADYFPTTAQ